MSKDRTLTNGKMPSRLCPGCGSKVKKMVRMGQLSFQCTSTGCFRWGPWEEARKNDRV